MEDGSEGAPPYDDRWGRSRPQELPDEVCLHHRKLNCKDATNFKDHTTDTLVLADDGINTEVPIGGGYGGGNQFLWHQDFWYWGVGNGTLPSNEGSPNPLRPRSHPPPAPARCCTDILNEPRLRARPVARFARPLGCE